MLKKKAPAKKKKAAKKKPARTPAQLAQIARRGPLPSTPLKTHPYAGLYGNRNAVGNSGRPPAYETPEEMQMQIDAYFEWIQGEFEMQSVEFTDPRTKKKTKMEQKVWIRHPEHATRTGLVLFMGFASHAGWDTYSIKIDTEFPAIVARAKARVEYNYEKMLADRDASRGSQFALTNMGWKNKTDVQQLDGNGDPTGPMQVTLNLG